jgi:predicted DNA binding CopG/RHH family protein
MKKLVTPKFKSEAEEAKWWHKHMAAVEQNLAHAVESGTAQRSGPSRVLKEHRESRNITIRVAKEDIERAQRIAQQKGIGYQTYLKMLMKEGLDRDEERKAG